MDKKQIITVINSKPKGSFVSLEGERPAKVKKSCLDLIVKHSVFQMRVGHSYYNQATTKAAHESGEREKYSPEKLWHEKSELGEAFRKHKKNGTEYVSGQPTGNKAVATWFRNGQKVTFSDVENDLLASEKKTEKTDNMFYCLENLTEAR